MVYVQLWVQTLQQVHCRILAHELSHGSLVPLLLVESLETSLGSDNTQMGCVHELKDLPRSDNTQMGCVHELKDLPPPLPTSAPVGGGSDGAGAGEGEFREEGSVWVQVLLDFLPRSARTHAEVARILGAHRSAAIRDTPPHAHVLNPLRSLTDRSPGDGGSVGGGSRKVAPSPVSNWKCMTPFFEATCGGSSSSSTPSAVSLCVAVMCYTVASFFLRRCRYPSLRTSCGVCMYVRAFVCVFLSVCLSVCLPFCLSASLSV